MRQQGNSAFSCHFRLNFTLKQLTEVGAVVLNQNMHYKNNRKALEGDKVVTKNYEGKVVVGVIYDLKATDACNCHVATLVPGGVSHLTCQNVNTMFHAEDAFAAAEQFYQASAVPTGTEPKA